MTFFAFYSELQNPVSKHLELMCIQTYMSTCPHARAGYASCPFRKLQCLMPRGAARLVSIQKP